jgi:hypothetical protein
VVKGPEAGKDYPLSEGKAEIFPRLLKSLLWFKALRKGFLLPVKGNLEGHVKEHERHVEASAWRMFCH